ncbi:hypothetical protein D9M69_407740 [compost metagenome]
MHHRQQAALHGLHRLRQRADLVVAAMLEARGQVARAHAQRKVEHVAHWPVHARQQHGAGGERSRQRQREAAPQPRAQRRGARRVQDLDRRQRRQEPHQPAGLRPQDAALQVHAQRALRQSGEPGAHHGAVTDRQPRCASRTEARIQRAGGLDLLWRGHRTHRGIADHAPVDAGGRHGGGDPVEVAVLAAVLDHAHPGAAGFQVLPQVGKRLGRHVGVAHQVVRRAQQFLGRIAAGLDKGAVGEGDTALEVRARDQVVRW